jgi:hypothetical protein
MENINVTEENTLSNSTSVENTDPQSPNYGTVNLTTVEITNEIVALNVMVSYLNIAQKRGAFAIDESSKIWECIQKFIASNKQSN